MAPPAVPSSAGERAPTVDEVVVDGAAGGATESICQAHGATYLTNPNGYGHMTERRNLGWRRCSTEIVTFLDDDAFVTQGWVEATPEPFADPGVGGVGGRAIQNADQEPVGTAAEVGRVGLDSPAVAGATR